MENKRNYESEKKRVDNLIQEIQHLSTPASPQETAAKELGDLLNILSKNIPIACKCNTKLVITKPFKVYGAIATASCDLCNGQLQTGELIFHCPMDRSYAHADGYDVCLSCAVGDKQSLHKKRKQLLRFKKCITPAMLTMFEQNKKPIQKHSALIIAELPHMMDVQQNVFDQLLQWLTVLDQPGTVLKNDEEDEEAEIGVDDDAKNDEHASPADQEWSLKQMYAVKERMNECVVKLVNVSKALDRLCACVNSKVNEREHEWMTWTADDIVDWIVQLENGRFAQYEETLRAELNAGDATGAILEHLTVSDWRKSFSIINWKDAADLNASKNELIANKKNMVAAAEEEAAAQKQYVSPFDHDIDASQEGVKTK